MGHLAIIWKLTLNITQCVTLIPCDIPRIVCRQFKIMHILKQFIQCLHIYLAHIINMRRYARRACCISDLVAPHQLISPIWVQKQLSHCLLTIFLPFSGRPCVRQRGGITELQGGHDDVAHSNKLKGVEAYQSCFGSYSHQLCINSACVR